MYNCWFHHILYIVNNVATCGFRERYEHATLIKPIKTYEFEEGHSLYKTLLWSISLRISYGGTKGDMKMLQWFIDQWYHRYKHKESMFEMNHNSFDMKSIKVVDKTDILLSAVDFHCSYLLNLLSYSIPDIDSKTMKDLIWFNRSSVSKKTDRKGEKIRKRSCNPKLYKKIEKEIDLKSKHIIDKYF